MRNVIYNTIVMVSLAVVVLGIAYLLSNGMRKQEVADCEQWQQYASEYANWYATNSERNMCVAVGVELPADNR